jgi:hypothetical protein
MEILSSNSPGAISMMIGACFISVSTSRDCLEIEGPRNARSAATARAHLFFRGKVPARSRLFQTPQ